MTLKKRKRQLIAELKKGEYYHFETIIKIIKNNSIDNNLISKITEKDTILEHNNTKLNANKQFLSLLSDFIYNFNKDYYFLDKDCFIYECLLNNTNIDYLLCKKHIGDNKYTKYFDDSYKNLVIQGFVQNIIILYPISNLVKELLKNNKIAINNLKSLTYIETQKIYELLLKLSFCNATFFNVFLLFENIDHYILELSKDTDNKPDNLKTITIDFYKIQLEKMIREYYKKVKYVNILIDKK